MSHEKALQAARDAMRAAGIVTWGPIADRHIQAAVDAYLSALVPDEVAAEEQIAWRWKPIGRTDVDAWEYQFGHPQLPDTHYITEPVYSASTVTALAARAEKAERERDEARKERDENFADAKRASSEYHALGKENLANHRKVRTLEAELSALRARLEEAGKHLANALRIACRNERGAELDAARRFLEEAK